jgi:hypothetical protein
MAVYQTLRWTAQGAYCYRAVDQKIKLIAYRVYLATHKTDFNSFLIIQAAFLTPKITSKSLE